MLVPFLGIDANLQGLPSSLIWSATYILGVLANWVLVPSRIMHFIARCNVEVALLSVILGLLAIASVTMSPDPVWSARFLLNITGGAAVLLVILGTTLTHQSGLKYLILGLIIAAPLVFILALSSALGSGLLGRLALHQEGGGVRALANSSMFAFLALVMIAARALGLGTGGRDMAIVSGAPLAGLLLLVLAIPILSVSRGIIFSITFTGLFALLLSFGKTVSRGAVRRPFLYAASLGLCALISILLLLPLIMGLTGEAFGRLLHLDITEDRSFQTRLDAWASGFEHFSLINFLFGNGVNVFRFFSFRGLYEHSVFISILHSGGLVTLLVFSVLCAYWFLCAAIGGVIGLFLVTLMVGALTFATHGTIIGLVFWVYLGILASVARLPWGLSPVAHQSRREIRADS